MIVPQRGVGPKGKVLLIRRVKGDLDECPKWFAAGTVGSERVILAVLW